MSAHLYLTEGGVVKDAITNLTVGSWCKARDPRYTASIFIPMELEKINHSGPATHKGVMAEHRALNNKRFREEAIYDPYTKKFTVRYIEV